MLSAAVSGLLFKCNSDVLGDQAFLSAVVADLFKCERNTLITSILAFSPYT